MSAEAIITGQSDPSGDTSTTARIAELAASVNAAVAAFQDAITQFNAGIAVLATHARVLADDKNAGHFRLGMGFEYDPETGTHNVNGTASYKADLAAALGKLGTELRVMDAVLQGALDAMQTTLTTKADTTTMQTALSSKAPVAHPHTIANTTGLQSALDTKADTATMQTALNGKAASSHQHTIDTVTSLQAALNGKAASNHGTHVTFGTASGTCCQGNDARLSNARTPTAHVHTIANTTGLQSALDAKASVADVKALQDSLTRMTWAGPRSA